MKNYPHIIAKVCDEPWLITPEKHRAIQRALDSRMTARADDSPMMVTVAKEPENEPEQNGKQLVIPVFGIIGKRLSWMETECGGYDLQSLEDALDVAEDEDSITEILLHIDSPGGTVTGVPEMAARIARINKKVVAFTDTKMCSAAYYLASGADEIYCTESADVGSIGVYAIYMDYSRQLANDGVAVNAISAGTDKLMGAWFKPMSDADRAKLQADVDKIYARFKGHVSAHRTDIPDSAMQGNVFDGEDAVANGLVDGVVDSISDLLL